MPEGAAETARTGGNPLSVIILTRNEELNLPACLESLRPLEAEVFVVDSGSTDRTVALALAAGCQVFEHPFETQAAQLNWALGHLPLETPWVMRLDADERLLPGLAEELSELLPRLPGDVTGLLVRMRVYFWGRWMRHGGYYPLWLLRLFRAGRARCEQRWMDEHMVLSSGRTLRLEGELADENRKGLSFWTDKHNRYSDREVRDLLAIEAARGESGAGLVGQARRRRWLKENLYARSPLFVRAFLYWAWRYFLRLGFLDGLPGLVFHFLQAFWYRFLADAKLYELRRTLAAGGSAAGPALNEPPFALGSPAFPTAPQAATPRRESAP
jgi:glycosyltransferase involved in cell wall biosynthesis